MAKSKSYTKLKTGQVHGTLVPPRVGPLRHSPEEEQNIQRLIERLAPLLVQQMTQRYDIDEWFATIEGDFVQMVYNIITNYINNITNIIGSLLTAGDGIKIDGNVISVRDGDGLDASSGDLDIDLATNPGLQITSTKLEAKCGDRIDKDANGIKADLHNAITTTGTGSGLELTAADGTGKLQVAPEDFLKMS